MKRLFIIFLLSAFVIIFSGCEALKEAWDALPDFTVQEGENASKECTTDENGKETCVITYPKKDE